MVCCLFYIVVFKRGNKAPVMSSKKEKSHNKRRRALCKPQNVRNGLKIYLKKIFVTFFKINSAEIVSAEFIFLYFSINFRIKSTGTINIERVITTIHSLNDRPAVLKKAPPKYVISICIAKIAEIIIKNGLLHDR